MYCVFLLCAYAKKQSPLAPDRNHFHHLLQNKGLSHAEVTVTLLTAQFAFASLTFFLQGLSLNLIVGNTVPYLFQLCFSLKESHSCT
jgi:UDP-N-acetylmuramyl pentapeptide phosphotransferase/UDP-N-acetylglucosamine-1-phosphate transferase